MIGEVQGGGPCGACGSDPASGFASCHTATHGEMWLCHPDDPTLPDCYALHSHAHPVTADLLAAPHLHGEES